MTNIEAMKLALDELEVCRGNVPIWVKAIAALRQAISEAEQADINLNCKSVQKRLATSWGYVKAEQEPVGVIEKSALGLVRLFANGVHLPYGTKLYTAPPKAEQEPVAFDWEMFAEDLTTLIKAYTDDLAAPPQREWVSLTEDEIHKFVAGSFYNAIEFARAIETKLKELNK